MGREKRIALIKDIESKRDGRLLISYITSTRTGVDVKIADDILPYLYRHLEAGKEKAQKGVDLFLHSNGGSGTAPWRIVNLIREYTKNLAVLVPHHAFSAATLIALGADTIVMHKMGCLGPIDPSVANAFNPPHPQNPGVLVPISVEDVSAYFKLVKEDIGITHEDELVQALIALTEKIHPLALGNVQRSHNQSRMLAKKLLKIHMPAEKEHEIDIIIENLKSNLFYHGHPINRHEAKNDLKLKVEKPPVEVEALMWDLYQEYAAELNLMEPYHPLHEWEKARAAAGTVTPAAPPTPAQILTQMGDMAKMGLGLGTAGVTEKQLVEIAAAMIPHVSGTISAGFSGKATLEKMKGGYLEALDSCQVFLTDLTIERVKVNTPAGPQDGNKQELVWQRWETES